MAAIRPITSRAHLDAALELLELLCPGQPARSGRDRSYYRRQFDEHTLFTAEDRDSIVGIFLGTPSRPANHVYYDAMAAPGVDPEPVIADLLAAAANAAADRGYLRMFTHEPVDNALLYEHLGHTPTLRLQFNGRGRAERRARMQRELGCRILRKTESTEWVDSTFRIDRVDHALLAELSARDQHAMHMMHTWTSESRPSYVATSHRRYGRQAITELRDIDPDLTSTSNAEIRQLYAGRPGHDLIDALGAEPVTFTHSVAPATIDLPLTGDHTDLGRIVAAARRLPLTGGTFAVECRNAGAGAAYSVRDVEIRVGMALDHPVDLVHPDQVISIHLDRDRALIGLSHNGFADRIRRTPATVISRAEHKLAEALDAFAITPTGRALDLGAAPGGWSYVLADRGMDVLAVDPGDLDPRVAERVTHVRARAERLDLAPASIDLIVNDMNLDPVDSAVVMSSVAGALKPEGVAIMTIKLPQRRPEPGIAAATQALAPAYDVVALKHLPHNRQEVTALLRPATVRG